MKGFEREDMLRLGNRRVRVATSGDGPALLLLNGIGAPVEIWQPLLPQLGQVRAIAFDAPGSGGTAAGSWPLSMRGHAQLALDVLDALACPRAAVLGFSFGGLVAQELAFSAAARVERLVLASTSLRVGQPARQPAGAARARFARPVPVHALRGSSRSDRRSAGDGSSKRLRRCHGPARGGCGRYGSRRSW